MPKDIASIKQGNGNLEQLLRTAEVGKLKGGYVVPERIYNVLKRGNNSTVDVSTCYADGGDDPGGCYSYSPP
jgi:hypothetical protein